MCQTACPVLIDTGDLVKRLRARADRPRSRSRSGAAAARTGRARRGPRRAALTVAGAVPAAVPGVGHGARPQGRRHRRRARVDAGPAPGRHPPPPRRPDRGGRRHAGRGCTSRPASTRCSARPGTPRACSGASRSSAPAPGVRLRVPDGIDSLCCGTPWSSKGLPDGYEAMRERVRAPCETARRWRERRAPVVISDAASCTEGYLGMLRRSGAEVAVVDAVAFVADGPAPAAGGPSASRASSLHPTCSSTRLGLERGPARVARAVADERARARRAGGAAASPATGACCTPS